MKNWVENYLSMFKSNRIIAVIIVIGMAIIAFGSVADSLGKISAYFSSESKASTSKEVWMDIQFEIINNSNKKIKISNLVEYYVTESRGATIHEYPKGRVVLNRFPTNLKLPNTIEAASTGYFTFEFPKSQTYKDLLLRGAGNVHFFLLEEGRKKPHLVSIPFHRQYFSDKNSMEVILNSKT
ncbi:MAG: hypothetical protein GQ532_14200 [Methylomarinum sp.]|nr:hypothetical protein [Methylomarinum sp.]